MAKHSLLQEIVNAVYEAHKSNNEGMVASYIPALADADPEAFGIAITTVDGTVVSAGDVDSLFSIQSISKPLVYGLALETFGAEAVHNNVGSEPSGEAFNAIELNAESGLPFNPMINAGAIAVTGMLYERFGDRTSDELLALFSNLAGETVEIDQEVYESELEHGSRNRALAYLMQSVGVYRPPVEPALAAYFHQCSALVNARSLSMIAATLANIGTHPITGERQYSPMTVRQILSLMFSCGMYDFAGRWAVDVGIPAKSGVAGGVMAVINRQFGMAMYSPRLDPHGNSVRAIAACRHLAEELGLHVFEFSNIGSSIAATYLRDSE